MKRRTYIETGGSLFLDRDGVINRLLVDSYVLNADQLVLEPGAVEAIALCNKLFRHVFVVTNQSCIGKGLTTLDELQRIHSKLIAEVEAAGGHIDHIYACYDTSTAPGPYRKPNIGMALQARRDFVGVKLRKSVMVGDTYNDMLFGYRCRMQTVLIGHHDVEAAANPHLVDFAFPSLADFAASLQQN
ncbi:MAG: HAD-IIIA family hydrolase [Bacteroidales bacterium]|nr:HAD-IIIA family hydrolase [Bacteroidales bacterium]